MAPDQSPEDDPNWIDRVSAIAGALGFNRVRVRWRLQRWVNRRRKDQRREEQRIAHIKYQHKVCSACGAVQDRSAKVCSSCGEKLSARWAQVLSRSGLTSPEFLSMSSIIGAILVVVYARTMLSSPKSGLLDIDITTLIVHGGNFGPAISEGHEYWRLGTAVLLHGGLWHLGFNLIALTIIGPRVEELYGRIQSVIWFVFTGLLASLASHLMTPESVSIGASGAIMGLLGVAAGWGHRNGTPAGLELRNDMLKWLAYATIFGFFLNVDHWAHFGGFAAGGIIGYFVDPVRYRRRTLAPVRTGLAVVAGTILFACTVFAVFPTSVGKAGLPSRWLDEAIRYQKLQAGELTEAGVVPPARQYRLAQRVDISVGAPSNA